MGWQNYCEGHFVPQPHKFGHKHPQGLFDKDRGFREKVQTAIFDWSLTKDGFRQRRAFHVTSTISGSSRNASNLTYRIRKTSQLFPNLSSRPRKSNTRSCWNGRQEKIQMRTNCKGIHASLRTI